MNIWRALQCVRLEGFKEEIFQLLASIKSEQIS